MRFFCPKCEMVAAADYMDDLPRSCSYCPHEFVIHWSLRPSGEPLPPEVSDQLPKDDGEWFNFTAHYSTKEEMDEAIRREVILGMVVEGPHSNVLPFASFN